MILARKKSTYRTMIPHGDKQGLLGELLAIIGVGLQGDPHKGEKGCVGNVWRRR